MVVRNCGPVLFILFSLSILIFYSSYGRIRIDDFKRIFVWGLTGRTVEPILRNSSVSNKWIVITSIYKPTEAIKIFSEMPGWQLLVIGDKKTPSNWSHKNAIYLGVDEQNNLPYSTASHIPWNTYTRKMIGYLYAIQHGAEYIYESDDDNVPNQNLSLFNQSHPYRLIAATKNLTFNPYAHFGQSTVWPRGYPLDRIGMPHPPEYNMCLASQPTIVQSLVNGDPDVDAIYRLTRRHSTIRLDIHFDAKAPLYLNPAGSFSPFNSQNTLFHKKSFWGLLLPTTVTDRATDIFRSYWTQRLMWIVGQNLAFGPATFYQKRNDHNLIDDLDQEYALYVNVEKYIKTLNSWNCSSRIFEECILELTRVVVDAGFWKEKDYDLVVAWLSDLKYIDKSLLDHDVVNEKYDSSDNIKHSLIFYPEEQMTSFNYDPKNFILPHLTREESIMNVMNLQCGLTIANRWKQLNSKVEGFPNVALVVSIYGDVETSLPAYEALYRFYFNKIIYCVDKHVSKTFLNEWKATMIFLEAGNLSTISCMTSASLMNLNVRGFLHLSDNMYFNITSLWRKRSFKKVWLPSQGDILMNEDVPKLCSVRPNRCRKLALKRLKEVMIKFRNKTFVNLSPKIKNRFMESLIKIEETLHGSSEIMVLTDLPMYIPETEVYNLYIFASNSWISIEVMTQLLFNFYRTTSFRLQHVISGSSHFDYRSDIKIVTFLNNEFCKYF